VAVVTGDGLFADKSVKDHKWPINGAQIWSLESGALIRTLSDDSNKVVTAEFDPAGDRIVTSSFDYLARVWSTKTGELVATLTSQSHDIANTRSQQNKTYHPSAFFSPDGRWLLAVGADGVHVFRADNLTETSILNDDGIWVASISSDSKWIASSNGNGGWMRIWERETGREYCRIIEDVYDVAFAPLGRKLISLAGSVSNSVKIWNLDTLLAACRTTGSATWSEANVGGAQLETHGKRMLGIRVAPNGDAIIMMGSGATTVWSIASGKPIYIVPFAVSGMESIFVSNSKKVLAASHAGKVSLFEINPSELMRLATERVKYEPTKEEAREYGVK
jgi:WD40 repeat protein